MQIEAWIMYGKKHNFCYMLVVKDLEDRDLFPVYFTNSKELEQYVNNIISESKLKVMQRLDL